MAAQFQVTLATIELVKPHLLEHLTTAEKRQAATLDKKIEKMVDKIGKFADRIDDFYSPLADKYGVAIDFNRVDAEEELVRFQHNLVAVNAVIFTLSPQFTAAEQKRALKLSYDECDFAEVIGTLNDEITTWYTATAEKYDGSDE